MYRNPKDPFIQPINVLLNNGGLGDYIAQLPVISYTAKQYPHTEIHLWVPDFFVELAEHLLHGQRIKSINPYSKIQEAKEYPAFVTKSQGHTTMKTSATDHAARMLLDHDLSTREKNYPILRISEINPVIAVPTPYVVITTGYTSKTRELGANVINQLSDYICGKGYFPVYLGNDSSDLGNGYKITGQFDATVDYSKGLDLRNRTTLLQAGHVMAYATAVVGLDNGLLHLAACNPETNIIGAFTTVDPFTRMPIRNDIQGYRYKVVRPNLTLGCRFCQTNMNFMPNHDFRKCFYDDYECTKQITAAKFIEHLEVLL